MQCIDCIDGHYHPERDCQDTCRTDDDCDDGICIVDENGTSSCVSTVCENDSDCHNGKCVIFPGEKDKSCLCPMTHAGPFCESERTCVHESVKYQRPCLNGGICGLNDSETKSDFLYSCDCSETYFTGFHCEEVHPCHPLKVF